MNHVDGNKLNNRADNLSLVTRSENLRHAIDVLGKMRGASCQASRLLDGDIPKIRALHATDKLSLARIGKQFGVNASSVHDVVRRKTWRHVP